MDIKKRILYIEDNFQNRRLVNRLLTKKGYVVIEAEDGLQGIAVAASEKPALILMDINLPGIDGMEATSRIKSSPDLSQIPIVAVTAAAMRGDRERIIAAGCDDYLQKPIDNDELVNTVLRYIGPGEEMPSAPIRTRSAVKESQTSNLSTTEPEPTAISVVSAPPVVSTIQVTIEPTTVESSPEVPANVSSADQAAPNAISNGPAKNPSGANSPAA